MFYFFLVLSAVSFEISMIPPTGTPPDRKMYSSAVYDSQYNRIITIGGYNLNENEYFSSINTYDLSTNLWGEIFPESFNLPGICLLSLYLRNDRKVLAFFGQKQDGFSSQVFSFDLNTYLWNTETLSGDSILGRYYNGFTYFTSSNTTYLAFFGGLTHKGADNNLFL